MFQLKNLKDKIQTRNFKIFEVQKANKDRLRSFAMIYMQRLLNSHVQK